MDSIKPVQVLKPFFRVEECLDQIRECLEIGWSGAGYKTNEFEDLWNSYTGHRFTIFQNSATASLHTAIHVLKMQNNWEDQDEILTPSLTFVSTNHVILYEKLKPVFVDVDESLCMDLSDMKSKITPKTKAVIFVGMGGRVGNYLQLVKYCVERDIKVILDAAHMAGTKINDIHPGTLADVACYSFQAVKNLPTGDSGAVCFKDEKQHQLGKAFSWLGIDKDTYARSSTGNYVWKYDLVDLGFKYNGNAIMAALAIVGLKYLDQDNKIRRENNNLYANILKHPKIQFIQDVSESISSNHLTQILVENRDDLIQYLTENKVYPGVHYVDNRDYYMYKEEIDSCPHSTTISKKLVTLPNHLWLSPDEIERVSALILHFLNNK